MEELAKKSGEMGIRVKLYDKLHMKLQLSLDKAAHFEGWPQGRYMMSLCKLKLNKAIAMCSFGKKMIFRTTH